MPNNPRGLGEVRTKARVPAACIFPVLRNLVGSIVPNFSASGLKEDKRHFHCLKHSLGVSLVEANVNLAVIQQALGHKSIVSAAVFTVPTDETPGRRGRRSSVTLSARFSSFRLRIAVGLPLRQSLRRSTEEN